MAEDLNKQTRKQEILNDSDFNQFLREVAKISIENPEVKVKKISPKLSPKAE